VEGDTHVEAQHKVAEALRREFSDSPGVRIFECEA
jgi:hypothetical protein